MKWLIRLENMFKVDEKLEGFIEVVDYGCPECDSDTTPSDEPYREFAKILNYKTFYSHFGLCQVIKTFWGKV